MRGPESYRALYGYSPMRQAGRGAVSSGGAAYTEDFESDALGPWTSSDWNEDVDKANHDIIAAGVVAAMPTQHLRSTNHIVGNGVITYTAGPSSKNGTMTMEFLIDSGSAANAQPSMVGRWVDVNNHLDCRFDAGFDKLSVYSWSGGAWTLIADSAWNLVFNHLYYGEVIMNDLIITINLYNASDKTTVIATASSVTCTHNSSGLAGLEHVGQSGAIMHYDNFTWSPA